MKKFCLLVLLAILAPELAHAQPQIGDRHDIVFTMGIPADSFFTDYTYSTSVWDLYSGYEGRYVKEYFTPVFGLQYRQFVAKRISVGAMAAWGMHSDSYFEPVEDLFTTHRSHHNFYLMAQARYFWLEKGYWQLYSGAGIGGKLTATFTERKYKTMKPGLAYEAILLGFRESSTYPVFAELVFGNSSFIGRVGIGFTF